MDKRLLDADIDLIGDIVRNRFSSCDVCARPLEPISCGRTHDYLIEERVQALAALARVETAMSNYALLEQRAKLFGVEVGT